MYNALRVIINISRERYLILLVLGFFSGGHIIVSTTLDVDEKIYEVTGRAEGMILDQVAEID